MFPSSISTYQGYTGSETLQVANNASQLNQMQSDTIAIETKLGTGASTPTSTSVLVGNGSGTSAWGQVALSNMVTGVLPTTNGGTGTTSTTGSGSVVFGTSPTITNPTESGGTYNSATLNTPTTNHLSNTSGLTNAGGLNTDTVTASGNITENGNPIWQYLGYAQITGGFTTTSGTVVQVTGLTVTVTVPTGATKVKITAVGPQFFNTTSTARADWAIWSGTVGSGTQLYDGYGVGNNGYSAGSVTGMAVIPAVAGSQTYNIGMYAENGGTATLQSASTNPAFILVECC